MLDGEAARSPSVVLVVDEAPLRSVVEVVDRAGSSVVVVVSSGGGGGGVVVVVVGASVTTNWRGAGSGSGRTAR